MANPTTSGPHFLIAKIKKLYSGSFQHDNSLISRCHLIEGMGLEHLLKLGNLYCVNSNLEVILESQDFIPAPPAPSFLCHDEHSLKDVKEK